MSHSRWNLLPPVPDHHPLNNSTFSPLIAQLLYNRGLADTIQSQTFLAADDRLSVDPHLLPDTHRAIARIFQALRSGENIAVYGDFDVDGITATAILVQGLSALDGKVVPYIPHRLTEGYGLTVFALEKLHNQGISLVITVDCGITSTVEIKKAREMGLDIIVTDHHTPLPEIPPAVAVVNPKLAHSSHPLTDLSGSGVAFKLLQALLQSIDKETELFQFFDLVALGTIADMSPLVGENRYLVNEGLKLINAAPRLGIRAIADQAGLKIGSLSAESVSWVIAPCLNAAGRLAHALTSYNLLLTDSAQEAVELARWLAEKNTERQKLTTAALANAREQVLSQEISPLLLVSDNDYHLGIAGLVASRLSEEFYRPSVVVKTGEKVSSGSCRSIPEFNIIAALTEFSHLMSHFGGHSQAAGFTLPTKNLADLERLLCHLAATQLDGIDLRPHLDIDVLVTLPELGGETFQTTQGLAPFGRGNPLPTFLSRGVEVVNCRTMGSSAEHVRLKLKQDGTVWDGVGFRLGSHLAEVSSHLDIVYNLEIDRWDGRERLRLNLLDFTPAS
ncbi:single-stranded-DNA-specific exonuclease RecJ [Chloroflexota bacterium]